MAVLRSPDAGPVSEFKRASGFSMLKFIFILELALLSATAALAQVPVLTHHNDIGSHRAEPR